MKPAPLLLCAAAAIACAFAGPAARAQDAPNLQRGRYLLSADHPMLAGNLYTKVSVCDWNADGKKDLLVGVFYKGNVVVFLNHGTDADPVFGGGQVLMADGAPIALTYG